MTPHTDSAHPLAPQQDGPITARFQIFYGELPGKEFTFALAKDTTYSVTLECIHNNDNGFSVTLDLLKVIQGSDVPKFDDIPRDVPMVDNIPDDPLPADGPVEVSSLLRAMLNDLGALFESNIHVTVYFSCKSHSLLSDSRFVIPDHPGYVPIRFWDWWKRSQPAYQNLMNKIAADEKLAGCFVGPAQKARLCNGVCV